MSVTKTVERPRPWSGLGASALLVALLVAAVYSPTLGHGFVWDDHEQIVNNRHIRDWTSIPHLWRKDILSLAREGGQRSNYYRPLFYVQYLVYYRLLGLNAPGWHALAIFHHALACVAVLLFLSRLGLGREVATGAAALFAVHPAHGESVGWLAAAFNDPPAATAILGALAFHAEWVRTRQGRHLVFAAGSFAVALGLKESALCLLFLVPLLDAFLRPEESWSRRFRGYLPSWGVLGLCVVAGGSLALPAWLVFLLALLALAACRWLESAGWVPAAGLSGYAPYVAVAAGYLCLRKAVLSSMLGVYPATPSLVTVLATLPSALLFYLRLLLWPFGLSPAYPLRYVESGKAAALAAGLLALALGLAFVLARRRRVYLFGLLWTLACLLPALNIRSFRAAYLVHQRYLYLACLGLCLIVAAAVAARVRVAVQRRAILASLVLLWSASLLWQHRYWASDVALWTRVAEVDPGNAAAFDWLGAREMSAGRLAAAEALFRQSIAADPSSPHGACNLATLLHVRRHEPARALPYYESVSGPRSLACSLNHGACLAALGRRQEALRLFEGLAGTPPYPAEAARNAAVLSMTMGQPERVEAILSQAVARHPRNVQLLAMLVDVYRSQGRLEEALGLAEELLALEPGSERRRALVEQLSRRH